MTVNTSTSFGRHAIVIGAGIGGLAAAGALADTFDRVTVLERDTFPPDASARPGAPQSDHPHVMLMGGLRAFGVLFPGFDQDLARAGAVVLRAMIDIREERPGYDPFPQRDLGWSGYGMSRPLLELVARRRVQMLRNVTLRENCRVSGILAAPDGAVAGVRCGKRGAGDEDLAADLVVDTSGRGALTLAFLQATGRSKPEQTTIGIDINYFTTTFELPKGESGWKAAVTLPDIPANTAAGCLLSIEGGRWLALVGEWHGKPATGDTDDFIRLARRLRTSTIYDAIKNAKQLDGVHHFRFPESSWRHYERMIDFPRGLVPLGDAICRFNPIYGQGMTVAAQEACTLKDLLRSRIGGQDPLAGLGDAYFAGVHPLIATAWSASAIPDFIFPQTRGERPTDLENSLRFEAGLSRLAARDPDVHKLMIGVRHLIELPAALHDPELMQRIKAELVQAAE